MNADQLIEQICELPTLATTVESMNNGIKDSELHKVILKDPALCSSILKMVNSTLFGQPKSVISISNAIDILGLERVKNIIASAQVFPMIKKTQKLSVFDIRQFWQHSLATAIASKIISMEIQANVDEEVFVCGLLHDIGKIALAFYCTEILEKIQNIIRVKGCLFVEAEVELELPNHTYIGRKLAEKWGFPETLQNIIAFHHEPFECAKHQKQILIVHLADILVRSLMLGNAGDFSIPQLTTGVLIELSLDITAIEEISYKILQNVYREFESLHLQLR